jgi:hypothetical protein
MRRSALLVLAPLFALGALCGSADVQAAKSKKVDPCAGATIWVTGSPYLPLALVRGSSISRPRGACTQRLTPDARFTSVDAAGKPVGVSSWVEKGNVDGLRPVSGREGVGLHALGETWKAPASTSFEADKELRRTFDAFYVHLAKQHPTSVTFFRSKAKAGSAGAPTTYAAASGRALVIGYLDEHDRWQVAHLDKQKAAKTKEPFHVRAVFDLNGDERPEVVVFLREEDLGYDVVLSPSRGGRRYRQVAENPDDGP